MRVTRHRLQSRQSDLGAEDAQASGRGDGRHRWRFVAGRVGGAHRASRRRPLRGNRAARQDGADRRDSRGHCARRAVPGNLRRHAVALCRIDRSARAARARAFPGIVHALCRKHGKSSARRLEFARSAKRFATACRRRARRVRLLYPFVQGAGHSRHRGGDCTTSSRSRQPSSAAT